VPTNGGPQKVTIPAQSPHRVTVPSPHRVTILVESAHKNTQDKHTHEMQVSKKRPARVPTCTVFLRVFYLVLSVFYGFLLSVFSVFKGFLLTVF